jgi:TPR repeat protein
MTVTRPPGLCFRFGALLLLTVLIAPPWALAQPKKEPASAQRGKDLDKGKGLVNQTLTREQAAALYRDGLAYEKKGNNRAALGLFLEAGYAGHGLAQTKLAGIYDRGNSATPRDYQAALHWYTRARAQGIEIPKPLAPIKGR